MRNYVVNLCPHKKSEFQDSVSIISSRLNVRVSWVYRIVNKDNEHILPSLIFPPMAESNDCKYVKTGI